MQDFTLNDGRAMPRLGLGTYQISDHQVAAVVRDGLDAGYWLVDTAALYGNERGVGEALARAGDAFVTTKLWNDRHGDAAAALDESLALLGLDAVDLFLIHWPTPSQGKYVQAWEALVGLREKGLARSIGVSNFMPEHIEAVVEATGVTPAVNQVELHPRWQQRELRAYHDAHGIVTQSWSPLGQGGDILRDPVIARIAEARGATAAQVIVAWHLASGLSVIPKSADPGRLRENLGGAELALSAEEVAAIDALDAPDGRIGPDPRSF